MIDITRYLKKYQATIFYIITVVVVNMMYSYMPYLQMFGCNVSPTDAIVGTIYVVRDFAQREIGHRVIFAMIVSIILSYLMAAPEVAFASVAAFAVGELIDWLIFTFTQRPLSDRLLWSAAISAPADSFVFIYFIGNLNIMEFSTMTSAKLLGVLGLWWYWRLQQHRGQTPIGV